MKRVTRETPPIPDKVYFRIGEVSRLVGVDTHVLRYWESEFSQIKPFRGKSKQRLYRRRDVECLLQIKELLHNEGYTISGARRHLKTLAAAPLFSEPVATEESSEQQEPAMLLGVIKSELRLILAQLGQAKQNEREQRVDIP